MSGLRDIPEYVAGHDLLSGKAALVTAAAGTGIGYSTAQRKNRRSY